jgi:predicted CopG family antitoxin
MMIRCGLATGHGDTIDDLIFELEKQIKNTSHAFSDALKKIAQLREALAEITNIVNPQYYGAEIQEIAREKLKEKE